MKQLPTESELEKKMLKDLDVVKNYFPSAILDKDGNEITMVICMVGTQLSCDSFEFRPDPVAPPDNTVVFTFSGGCKYRRISTGMFGDTGQLICYNSMTESSHVNWDNWCSATDRTNHSAGWKREWEPDFDGGAE